MKSSLVSLNISYKFLVVLRAATILHFHRAARIQWIHFCLVNMIQFELNNMKRRDVTAQFEANRHHFMLVESNYACRTKQLQGSFEQNETFEHWNRTKVTLETNVLKNLTNFLINQPKRCGSHCSSFLSIPSNWL